MKSHYNITSRRSPAWTVLLLTAILLGCEPKPQPETETTVAVTGVTLDKGTLTLKEGESAKLKATVVPAQADNRSLTWNSNDPAVAKVDGQGTVSALKEGTAVITVKTVDGGHTDECLVTVEAVEKPLPEAEAPKPYGACPTEGQVAWQRQELIMFYHFGPATFSGYDGEKRTWTEAQLLSAYAPPVVDADQWVKTAADNGFKEVILTAKHHDGFCLWDNPESTCDIANSACKNPTDVVKAVSDACAKYGVNFGVYLSPWDKIIEQNHYTTAQYEQMYKNALTSLMTGYGKITEMWFDGNHAGSFNWNAVNQVVLDKWPQCVIFSNVGPGCRWVGNEDGNAGETNWSTYSPSVHQATQSSLPGNYGSYLWQGDEGGNAWIPAECDFSIQQIGDNNGWFWGAGDARKDARQLMRIYYESVGRNSVFLMNVPPSSQGVIDSKEKAVIEAFHQMRTQIFSTDLAAGATAGASSVRGRGFEPANLLDGNYDSYFATPDGTRTVDIDITLDGEKTFNRVVLQEYIPLGQRVKSFTVQVKKNGSWTTWKSGTTIGHKRILMGSTVTTGAVRIQIKDALACPVLNGFSLYNDTVSGL